MGGGRPKYKLKCILHLNVTYAWGTPPPQSITTPSGTLFLWGFVFIVLAQHCTIYSIFTPVRVSSFVTTCVSSWHLIIFTPPQSVFFRLNASTNISLGIKKLGLVQFTAEHFINAPVIPLDIYFQFINVF